MTGKTIHAKRSVEFPCPFCGGKAAAVETMADDQMVVHSQPLCRTFAELDPLEYIVACGNEFEKKRKEQKQ